MINTFNIRVNNLRGLWTAESLEQENHCSAHVQAVQTPAVLGEQGAAGEGSAWLHPWLLPGSGSMATDQRVGDFSPRP